MSDELKEGIDYVYDNSGNLNFTPRYLIKQGKCCGSKCKYCPYRPKYIEGSTQLCCMYQKEGYKIKCENGR